MAKKEVVQRKTLEKGAALGGAVVGSGASLAVGTALAGANAGVLGSVLGTLGFAATVSNPVGWLVGGAALGAAALYGGAKTVGNKGYSDGDYNAHLSFNSDKQEQEYMQLKAKISQKDNVIAFELLEKLPSELEDFKMHAFDGLEKGSMSSQEVIQVCCEMLGEDPNNYLQKNDFSLDDIARVLKISILMVLADGVVEDEEIESVENLIKTYFNLTQEEFDLIFDVVLNEELMEKMGAMSFEEIQTSLVSFFPSYDNSRLKWELLDILDDIAEADGEVDGNESKLWLIWYSLLKTENRLARYNPYFEQLLQTQDISYFTSQNNPKAFSKKVPNALNAYAKNIAYEHVLCLHDFTLFGKADEGFVVTPYAIISDNDDNKVIVLSDIYDYEVDDDDILSIYGEPDDDELPYVASLYIGSDSDDFIDFIDAISKINQEVYDEDDEETQEFYDAVTEENKEIIQETYSETPQEETNTISQTLSDTKEWHLAQNNQQLGLHSLAEIDEKFANKELDSKDLLVWKEGMESWSSAEDVEQIAQIIEKYKVATPPPLPTTPPPLP